MRVIRYVHNRPWLYSILAAIAVIGVIALRYEPARNVSETIQHSPCFEETQSARERCLRVQADNLLQQPRGVRCDFVAEIGIVAPRCVPPTHPQAQHQGGGNSSTGSSPSSQSGPGDGASGDTGGEGSTGPQGPQGPPGPPGPPPSEPPGPLDPLTTPVCTLTGVCL